MGGQVIGRLFIAVALALISAAAFAETNEVQVAETNAVAATKVEKRSAKITAANTYYDRKEGVAIFTGKVFVDDEEYKLHADKAYVFTDGAEGLSRIVAVGHVAMTNDTKRAYGAKVSYHRANGMIVLYSGDGAAAEVRDEAKQGQDQVVRGSKIKFWVNSEQVEVINAEITAPADMKNIKEKGGKLL